MFVGRKQELMLLENMYHKKNAFVMITGQRFIGKTALIKQFLEGKRALYYSARQEVALQNRRCFAKEVSRHFHDAFNKTSATVPGWKEIFRTIAERDETSRKVLVIDNFTHLMQCEPGFDKIIKQAWESFLKKADVMLVLIASNDSLLTTMEDKKSSLLNSVTLRMKLQPVTFVDMLIDYPNYNFDQVMTLYAITGGIPKYWPFFTGCMSTMEFMNGVKRTMMSTTGSLYDFPATLLERDIWEPAPYFSLLATICEGYHQPKDLGRILDLKPAEVKRYLQNLMVMGYIEMRVPITEKNDKRAGYYFADPMLYFWFTFIYPFREQLESGETQAAFDHLKTEFPAYIQYWFQAVAREIFKAATQQRDSEIPFEVDRMGVFWNREEDHIDVFAVDEQYRRIFMADTVYRNKPYSYDEFNRFKENCENIRELKAFKNYTRLYGVFAASPFEKELMDYAAITEGVILFDGVTVYHK